jgi:alkylhydroperoxidase family enzyme
MTHTPAAVGADDVDALRGLGWTDPAIHDAVQVVAYFNYVNRVADAVGIEAEPDWAE